MKRPRLIPATIICTATLLLASSTLAQRKTRPILDEGDGFATTAVERHHEPPPQLLLERGINVEDHPNGYSLHASRSPAIAAACELNSGPACAIISWQFGTPPVTGGEYHASVPAVVTLRGEGGEVWWTPAVHCVTWDGRRRLLYKVSSGRTCMNVVDAETQEMQWFVGGQIEGFQSLAPGTYTGWVPVTFTSGSQHWVVDIPVSYRRYHPDASCSLDAGGNISITGIPLHPDSDERGGNIDITATTDTNTDITITGNLEDLCGGGGEECSSLSAQTGWARIKWHPATSFTFSIDATSVGFGSDTEDWEFHVGYYQDGTGFHIQTDLTPSFDESANVYTDADGVAHIFIGGNIDIPSAWATPAPAREYTGTATLTLACGT